MVRSIFDANALARLPDSPTVVVHRRRARRRAAFCPGLEAALKSLAEVLPGLRGWHLIDGAGHWIQRERAAAVDDSLLAFLRSL